MPSPLQILHLEDDLNDSGLVVETLAAGGMLCEVLRVDNQADFTGVLHQARFDLILADYTLPSFDGATALVLVRKYYPDLPFIFVSGTLGEEVAIESLKSGATDYVLKSRLSRLVPAVRRALAEATHRADLKRAEATMLQSEHKYRHLFDCLADAAFLLDRQTGRVLDANKQAELLLGISRKEMIGARRTQWLPPALQFIDPNSPPVRDRERPPLSSTEGRVVREDGTVVPVLIGTSSVTLHGKSLQLDLVRDITERKRTEEALIKSEEAMRHLSVRILQSQDKERRRIASELHDNSSQNLAALTEKLSLLAHLVRHADEQVQTLLTESSKLADQTKSEIREFTALLHPPTLDTLGLPGALAEFVEGMARRSGILIEVNSPPDFGRLPHEVETALFRVVQQSLANRQSGGAKATVRLERDENGVALEVAELSPESPPDKLRPVVSLLDESMVGLPGMQERLHELGGRLEIESNSAGTRIRAILKNLAPA